VNDGRRWHLIDRGEHAGIAARRAAANDEPVLTIGGASLGWLVRSAGVKRGAYLSAPLRSIKLAGPAVKRAVARHAVRQCVVWSDATADLARRWTAGDVIREHAEQAEPAWQLHDEPTPHQTRDTLRQTLGLTDDTRCVLAVGGDGLTADAYDAAMALGLAREALATTDAGDLRLVTRPAQPGRRHAWSLWRDFALDKLLITDPAAAQPWRAIPAVDALLDLGPHPSPWRHWANALDKPVVGPASLPSRYGQVVDVRRLAGQLAHALATPATPADAPAVTN